MWEQCASQCHFLTKLQCWCHQRLAAVRWLYHRHNASLFSAGFATTGDGGRFVHRQGAGKSGAARRWPGTGSQGPPWSRGSRGTTHQQATSSSAGSQRVGLAGSPGVTPVAHSDPKLRARGTDEQQYHAKSVLFLSPVLKSLKQKVTYQTKKKSVVLD